MGENGPACIVLGAKRRPPRRPSPTSIEGSVQPDWSFRRCCADPVFGFPSRAREVNLLPVTIVFPAWKGPGFRRARADRMLPHVARRNMTGIDRGISGSEQREEGRLRSRRANGADVRRQSRRPSGSRYDRIGPGSRRAGPRRAEVTPALPARRAMQALSYDYIIVGAGSCGTRRSDFSTFILRLPAIHQTAHKLRRGTIDVLGRHERARARTG
jgi:hypothetical protein